MRNLTNHDFAIVWPNAVETIVHGILTTQVTVFPAQGITTLLRLAHFMAQVSAETGGGRTFVESLDYSAERLLAIFPKHFTENTADQYGRTSSHPANQKMIGNIAYGGRNGNRPGTDDGYNFRGMGLLQITGRSNYTAIGHAAGINLVDHPELIVDPNHALLIAAVEFSRSGCLPFCDQDDILAVSSIVNVGHIVHDPNAINGLPERKDWLRKWKGCLGL
jgi:putative chitinase